MANKKSDRLKKQLDFILEIDKLKEILRKNCTINSKKNENDAEHTWHLSIMAVILAEYASEKVDLLKTIKMLLIHDIVEIDAGDTFAYNEKANEDKKERERKAADRIFNILPKDQAEEIRNLWDEFELNKTNDAKFANAIDRFQPLILNYATSGECWNENDVMKNQVINRNKKIKDSSKELWRYAESLIQDSVKRGWLKDA